MPNILHLKVGLWLLLLWRCVERDKKNTGEGDKENKEERKRVWRRERWIKIKIIIFSIYVRIVSNIEGYCSMLQNFDTFETPHEAWIVVFGVSNAKYLAFDIPDGSALREGEGTIKYFFYYYFFYKHKSNHIICCNFLKKKKKIRCCKILQNTKSSSFYTFLSLSSSKEHSRSTIHPPPLLQHIIIQPKNQWEIKPKINWKSNPKSIKKSNQNSCRSCCRRCHGSLGGVFAAAMREWRFGPLFVAVLQLIFAATGDGEGFGALSLGWSLRWALAMADCKRKRVLELERKLGYGEESVLKNEKNREKERLCGRNCG